MFRKLKEKWNVDSNRSLAIIFLVFALTGSSSVKLAKPFLELIGWHKALFDSHWSLWVLYYTVRILVIFPLYQLLLLCFGWLLGQFSFFWAFEKKMFARMGLKKYFSEKDER
jgi:hypothetical protein